MCGPVEDEIPAVGPVHLVERVPHLSFHPVKPAPHALPHLSWLAWTSFTYASLAAICWYLSRRWHDTHSPISQVLQPPPAPPDRG